MVTPTAGAVVLIPFPFSDLSQSKLRPAVILADAGREDWILCQVTSKPYGDIYAIELNNTSFANGSLRVQSYARPSKIFTASHSLMVVKAGNLKPVPFKQIIEAIVRILQSSFTP
ncbi:MazF family transcriptional regulator [Candidatus Desantisbacteria bacterium CG2_30_40_21]|uniref:MazF family transcriptional regulator n=5 Tax=unclassified Candidatus Desantisiibacteriota TaxID=3106372 RepID=A0A2M7JEJ8_9BACT|nr:MAG: MazF family transcriptional regulator [Candidatus Desantisbacteria bacterium CG2_30_40_21]PIP41910.1 MAG: MazF family transcriptional regulator [Candidatus Desantisbacteria bacterium CG23_combo_of_CG06-09_8_20_14_all_40_23]PIX17829.1 MAG: MazF family transcriptional regulator [Candidatus Desantisbacteria bacterium CG_4_8_14_3_um_filter_40_12]PIY19090.1 MAG: MazF family transcriptional regulator [Candidatus Desantisbacteria bacterium CG_4_10_14_3_um_filter_40_18]PJB29323.1 MAG: MazF fami